MNLDDSKNDDNLSKIIFITGGTKSGKSEFAEYLATNTENLIYVALSASRSKDEDWQKKIVNHRKRRPKNWKLIETTDLIKVLKLEKEPLQIDSIGGFVMESLEKENEEWSKKINSLINLLQKRKTYTFIVGEQVGWSLVSEYKIGNKYIERIGELQKKITKLSQHNWLAINGRAIKIDEISIEIPS